MSGGRVSGGIYAKKGDTLTPWPIVIEDFNGTVPDLSEYETVQFHAFSQVACPATDLVAWTASNVTVQPTKDFTSDTTTGIQSLYCVDHGLSLGQQVKLTTTGALPTGLATGTRYYVVRINGHNFWLCKQRSGTPIAISTAGSGTHSFALLGHIQYQPQSADVDTVGTYQAEVRYGDTGGPYETFPATDSSGDAIFIPLFISENGCDA